MPSVCGLGVLPLRSGRVHGERDHLAATIEVDALESAFEFPALIAVCAQLYVEWSYRLPCLLDPLQRFLQLRIFGDKMIDAVERAVPDRFMAKPKEPIK